MTSNKIYLPFEQKINDKVKEQIIKNLNLELSLDKINLFRVIISFESLKNRELFLSKYNQFNFIKKIDVIPSIVLQLTYDQIQELNNEDLIFRIEEDQKLFLSMFDIIEILALKNYRTTMDKNLGNNIIIGIVDNGINQKIEAISEVVLNRYVISEERKNISKKEEKEKINHATLMAAIIGSRLMDEHNNYIGIAPGAKIVDFDISNSNEIYTISDVLEVFDLINKNRLNIDIVLIPLTTLDPSDGKDILSLACDRMIDEDIIIVCPAGNFGPESYTIGSPAAAKKVISIGATTKESTIAYYSGRGPTLDDRTKPTFCLPGSKVQIPLSQDKIVKFSGTSVSAAIGAGLIAIVKENNLNLTYNSLLKILKNAAIDLKYQPNSQGFGTINTKKLFPSFSPINQQIEVLPYNYIIRRSLQLSIEIVVLLLIIYYLVYFFIAILSIFNLF
ncbi:MAG: S8 family serine peptidase [Candidatus Hermodarchaeota archaeon]